MTRIIPAYAILLLAAPVFGDDFERGKMALGMNDPELAITCFTAHIAANPNDPLGYNMRGLAHDRKKETDKAIDDFSEAIRLSPSYANAYLNRGVDFRRQKDYEKAIKDFTDAISLHPPYTVAINNLAWLLATCPKEKFRDGKVAIALASKACELSEWKEYRFLSTLAAAHAETGDFKEAVKWAKKSIELGIEDKDDLAAVRKQLKVHEDGKPYRE